MTKYRIDGRLSNNIYIILFALCLILPADAGAGIRNDSIKAIIDNLWLGRYETALADVDRYHAANPEHPIGPLLRGVVLQSLSESYRNNRFKDEIDRYLSQAIDICDSLKRREKENPEWFFIAGAAYGYRGLHRAFQGSWWGAFKDGLRCKNNLKRTLKLDSTYYDAYWGLGAYHYYRTVKAKSFLWLPFVSDARERGQNEIRVAIDSGFLAVNLAREAMLRIHLWEGRYPELVALADSLREGRETEPYALLFYAEGLLMLDSLNRAEEIIDRLDSSLRSSDYYDSLGTYEVKFLRAKLAYRKGEIDQARQSIDKLLQMKTARKIHAYFDETYVRVKEYYKDIR